MRDGLPATSIGWGLWAAEGGMTGELAGGDRQRLARSGVRPLDARQGLALFDAVLASGRPHAVAARLDAGALLALARTAPLPAILTGLVPMAAKTGDGVAPVRARLHGRDAVEQQRMLLELLRGNVATVLGHASASVVDSERGFLDMGFDSLTAVELRNQLRRETGLPLPATVLFDYPTPSSMARYLHGEMFPAAPDGGLSDADISRALAAVSPQRLREAGLLDTLLRLAGTDPGPVAAEPEVADQTRAIEEAGLDDLIQLALSAGGDA
jgi:acyl carrier protein